MYLTGLFGRNRKPKYQHFNLAEDLETPLSQEALETITAQKLVDINARGSVRYRVREQPMILENDGSGIEMRTFMVFSDKCLIDATTIL
jgi:hypothetical protein